MKKTARIVLHEELQIGEISPYLYGTFVEHLGRCVYDGIYEPSHPQADADGFRQDVLALVRELGPTMVIYPEGVWYSPKTTADVDQILEKHVRDGGRVAALMLRPGDDPPKAGKR